MDLRRCAFALVFLPSCVAQLTFASYYGDHMVLQRAPERAVVWGFGPEAANLTVSLSGPVAQQESAVTVAAGIWRVTLQPMPPGGPYNLTVRGHNSSAVLTDVLFGDVWLCGGQSNMCFTMSQIFNSSEEIAISSRYHQVRPFQVSLKMSDTELTDLTGVDIPWSVPSPEALANFSAVCALFGRYMYDQLKYPIGLVTSCWGGTPVEAWSSHRALKRCGLHNLLEGDQHDNSVLWNAMIHPLVNMTIKGALWYQGERNAAYHRDAYNCSFPAMIDDWRMVFHEGSGGQTSKNFPFGFAQLCVYKKGSRDDGFPEIRWHQTADIGIVPNKRMPNTFMAVTLDLPDYNSPYGPIHPRDKQDVAYRLSLGARALAYDENISFLGPFPQHIFSDAMSFYIIYDQEVRAWQSVNIFEICCKGSPCESETIWRPAPMLTMGASTIEVSAFYCSGTSKVAAIRFAWMDWPCVFKTCPIYSKDGVLPAPPFVFYAQAKRLSQTLPAFDVHL
ncbi:sialate O-acetylesterase [Synchiropus picturatus]